MEFYKEHKNAVRITIAIILVIALLLGLKMCQSQLNPKDDTASIVDDINGVKKDPKEEIKDINAYIKKVMEIKGKGDKKINDLEGVITEPEIPFICDENTAQVYLAFGHEFQKIAYEYFSLSYIGDEPYADQDYFNLKFDYYTEFGEILINMGNAIKANDSEKVLKGFDALSVVIEQMEEAEL